MNLREKIKYLMQRDNIKTTAELSRLLDIPYKTLDNILRRDTFDNVKFSTLKKLCVQFDVDMRYLCYDEIEDANYVMPCTQKEPCPSAEAETDDPRLKSLVATYSLLNESGKIALVQHAELLKASGMYTEHSNIHDVKKA